MKINIACGTTQIKGFVNVDILDFGQEVVMDAYKYLNTLNNNTVIIAIEGSH